VFRPPSARHPLHPRRAPARAAVVVARDACGWRRSWIPAEPARRSPRDPGIPAPKSRPAEHSAAAHSFEKSRTTPRRARLTPPFSHIQPGKTQKNARIPKKITTPCEIGWPSLVVCMRHHEFQSFLTPTRSPSVDSLVCLRELLACPQPRNLLTSSVRLQNAQSRSLRLQFKRGSTYTCHQSHSREPTHSTRYGTIEHPFTFVQMIHYISSLYRKRTK
jgi:hypothetical protein